MVYEKKKIALKLTINKIKRRNTQSALVSIFLARYIAPAANRDGGTPTMDSSTSVASIRYLHNVLGFGSNPSTLEMRRRNEKGLGDPRLNFSIPRR